MIFITQCTLVVDEPVIGLDMRHVKKKKSIEKYASVHVG